MGTLKLFAAVALASVLGIGGAVAQQTSVGQTLYRNAQVDGIKILYREAGPASAPTVFLPHGFPSSSHMFRDLIPRLTTRYHVIAPDYPGFGYSDAPAPEAFEPTFASLTTVMEHFIEQRGIKPATFHLEDFGGPVGFRIAADHPEWVQALVIQSANAHEEGLAPQIKSGNEARRTHPTPADEMTSEFGSGLTDALYKHGASNPERISPASYTFDLWARAQPEHRRIGATLINNYYTNTDAHPKWQAYLRQHQPPTLIL